MSDICIRCDRCQAQWKTSQAGSEFLLLGGTAPCSVCEQLYGLTTRRKGQPLQGQPLPPAHELEQQASIVVEAPPEPEQEREPAPKQQDSELFILRGVCARQRTELRRMNKAFEIYQMASAHHCKFQGPSPLSVMALMTIIMAGASATGFALGFFFRSII